MNWEYATAPGSNVTSEDDKCLALWKLARSSTEDHTEFVVGVIDDEKEAWIVRAEALKYFRDVEFRELQRDGLCKAIATILDDVDEDITLRQWVAFYVGKCLSCPEVINAVM